MSSSSSSSSGDAAADKDHNAYNYVVTAHPSSSISHTLSGEFIPGELNLVVSHCTRLAIYRILKDGLERVCPDIPVFGRIVAMEKLRLAGQLVSGQDSIVFLTERFKICAVSWDVSQKRLVTYDMGDCRERIGRENQCGPRAIIDPAGRMIGVHVYDGLLRIIPISSSSGKFEPSFDVKLDELQVIDLVFMHGDYSGSSSADAATPDATLCVLYCDEHENQRHLRTHEIDLKGKTMRDWPWLRPHIDPQASKLVAVPSERGGVLVFGQRSISYHSKSGRPEQERMLNVPSMSVRAATVIDDDGSRFLVGDQLGGLHVLSLLTAEDLAASSNESVSKQLSSSLDSSASGAASDAAAGARQTGKKRKLSSESSDLVHELRIDKMGETSCASAISYLDNGVVFVGSHLGDSQLIRLSSTPLPIEDPTQEGGDDDMVVEDIDEDKSPSSSASSPENRVESATTFVDPIQEIQNLGPILDFAIVDVEKQGQGQVVTCSGHLKDGSLRVVRNGIGIEDQASIEMEGIKGMWSLRKKFDSNFDKYLVITFRDETHVLGIEGEAMEEVDISGLDDEAQTLACTNVVGDHFLQCTQRSVRLVDCATLLMVDEWAPAAVSKTNITVAGCNSSQALVAVGGGMIVFLQVEGKKLVQKGTTTLDQEVACIDLTPLDPQGTHANYAAVGMWVDMSVRVLSLPGLSEATRHQFLGGAGEGGGGSDEVIPRSVMFAVFDKQAHLLVGLGDGRMLNYEFSAPTITEIDGAGSDSCHLGNLKRIALGTQPIGLKTFSSRDKTYVFASSDRPTVVYHSSGKVLYSNVNRGEVTTVCSFNSEDFPDCLAIACQDGTMSIGQIDEIQKLHIRDEPLGESPTRIAHCADSSTFAVSTSRMVPAGTDYLEEKNFLRLLDDTTFEPLHSYPLDAYEIGLSITTVKFEGGNNSSSSKSNKNEYVVLGTAYALDDEPEPAHGRLLVFAIEGSAGEQDGAVAMDIVEEGEGEGSVSSSSAAISSRKLVLVSSIDTRGAVYSLEPFHGMLLAGINSKTQLYKWSPGAGGGADGNAELKSVCGHHGHILALYIRSHGDFIIVGDLMKSISLLVYKPLENTIDEIARDYNAMWMTSIAILDDDTYIGCDNSYNLFTVSEFFALSLLFVLLFMFVSCVALCISLQF